MVDKKVVPIEDRIPKLKEQRRQKSNRRFITYITLFFLLMAVVIYFKSPLSNVRSVNILGNHYVSKEKVKEISGLDRSTHIWDVKVKNVEGRLEKLSEVKQAKVKRIFPNKITIDLTEYQRIAYVKEDSSFIPILENGSYLPKLKQEEWPVNAPILIGWKSNKLLDQLAKELSQCPSNIIGEISEIHYTPTKHDEESTTLYMNDGNKMLIDLSRFSDNLKLYPEIKARLEQGEKGVVDMTVGINFTPYSKSKEDSHE